MNSVLGTASDADSASQYKILDPRVRCQQLLETWVRATTSSIRDWANVRTFSFDGAQLVQNGAFGLSQATIELSRRLTATAEDPSSPLFYVDGDQSRRRQASRAIVFIAHGFGTWVVKDLLALRSTADNRIDPSGLVFLDVPDSLDTPTPVHVPREYDIQRYFREFSEVFKLNFAQLSRSDLLHKLWKVDTSFHALVGDQYGKCEEIEEEDGENYTYTMKVWCDSIWMSTWTSLPLLTFENSKFKTFIRRASTFLPCRRIPEVEARLPELESVKLEEILKEAISTRVHDNVGREGMDIEDRPLQPTETEENTESPEKGKEKEEPLISLDLPRMLSTTSLRIPMIYEECEAEKDARVDIPSSSSSSDNSFFNFKAAITQRNEASEQNDKSELLHALHRLELVEFHQRETLRARDAKLLVTRREVMVTSLLCGIWNGKAIEKCSKRDLLLMESDTREIYQGLEESLGPLHHDTLEALTVLFSVRVSMVKNETLPWLSIATTLDLLKSKLGSREAREPERLVDTLRLGFIVASTLSEIWNQGRDMLDDLLEETDTFINIVVGKDFDNLSTLRFDIKKKIDELQRKKQMANLV
ncbi:hypothetical protein M426DRAFT_260201 [Hypoxylon sp. CI-4A]|nr:hypothetical protein M426DRAFT_260201 [Hypoxylon sp. CI-4A]